MKGVEEEEEGERVGAGILSHISVALILFTCRILILDTQDAAGESEFRGVHELVVKEIRFT